MTQPIHDGWTMARSAILTHQHRLAVTANNIANVDTPGYSRRDVRLSPVPGTPSSMMETRTWSHGAGVRVADVVRASNEMKSAMLRQQLSDTSGHHARADALTSLESLMQENGDSALGGRLDAFWNAWHDLSAQADNVGFRSVVIQRGNELASHLQSLAGRVDDFEGQIVDGAPGNYSGELAADVDMLNQRTAELQDLNQRISYASSSFAPHELMDRRDVLLQEISTYADVEVAGDYAVTLDGQTVVSADGSVRAALEITDAGPPPLFALDGAPVTVSGGQIGAWADVLGVSSMMHDRLDVLAVELAEAVNSIHNSDLNPTGDSYDLSGQRCDWDFFTATSASDIAVNTLIYDPADPMGMHTDLIAAAASYYDDGLGGTGPNAGDGTRALEMAELSEATHAALNEQGFGAFHATGLTLLGSIISTERTLGENGDAIVTAIEDELQSEVGVNLDEELMNMMSAQRAFQAGTKLLQTVDEMMQTLLQF